MPAAGAAVLDGIACRDQGAAQLAVEDPPLVVEQCCCREEVRVVVAAAGADMRLGDDRWIYGPAGLGLGRRLDGYGDHGGGDVARLARIPAGRAKGRESPGRTFGDVLSVVGGSMVARAGLGAGNALDRGHGHGSGRKDEFI